MYRTKVLWKLFHLKLLQRDVIPVFLISNDFPSQEALPHLFIYINFSFFFFLKWKYISLIIFFFPPTDKFVKIKRSVNSPLRESLVEIWGRGEDFREKTKRVSYGVCKAGTIQLPESLHNHIQRERKINRSRERKGKNLFEKTQTLFSFFFLYVYKYIYIFIYRSYTTEFWISLLHRGAGNRVTASTKARRNIVCKKGEKFEKTRKYKCMYIYKMVKFDIIKGQNWFRDSLFGGKENYNILFNIRKKKKRKN